MRQKPRFTIKFIADRIMKRWDTTSHTDTDEQHSRLLFPTLEDRENRFVLTAEYHVLSNFHNNQRCIMWNIMNTVCSVAAAKKHWKADSQIESVAAAF